MKHKRSYFKLALCMLFGAALGITGNFVISYSENRMKKMTAGISEMLHREGLLIEGLLILLASLAVISIYLYLRRLNRQEKEAGDEMADLFGEKFEQWAQVGIMLTNVAAGLILVWGCLMIPGNIKLDSALTGVKYLILAGLIILGGAVMNIMQIMIYHLMQKRDPGKKGDPAGLMFNKKWLESCDETEKLVIYQAGYKAYGGMQVTLLVGIVVALYGKTRFGTGDFPLVLLGCMWVAGTLNYGIWKMKGLKK